MKQTFTRKCGFMLLVMLFAFIQGTWAEGTKKVNVKFSTEEFTTEVGVLSLNRLWRLPKREVPHLFGQGLSTPIQLSN